MNSQYKDFVDLSNIEKDSHDRNDWVNSVNRVITGVFDNQKYKLKIIEYYKKQQKIKVEYNGQFYVIKTNNIISNKLNPIFYPKTKLKENEFFYEVGTIVNGMKIIDRKTEYKEYNTKERGIRRVKNNIYRRICCTCGYDNDYYNWSSEKDIKSGKGCPVCAGQKVIQGINDIPTTAPWMIPYFQGGYDEAKQYTCKSGKKIYPICPDCGRVKKTQLPIFDINRRNSIGCICSDGFSYPEKFMYSILTQLNVRFVYQLTRKQLRWCKNYKYDFYVPSLNMIIETHGQQHYDKDFIRSYKEQQQIDKEKRTLALSNNIQYYIELDCRYSDKEYIKKSIIHSELNNLINITQVNFDKCAEFATSNITKKVCELKKENPDYTSFELADIFNIGYKAVQTYLKNGNELGWCHYNAKEEQMKANKRTVKYQVENQKPIVVKDENNTILGIFINAHRLSQVSQKVFGFQLNPSNILESCREDNALKNVYKNLSFYFLEDYIICDI